MHSKEQMIKRTITGTDFPLMVAQKNTALQIDKKAQAMHPFLMGFIGKADEEYNEMRAEVGRVMIHPTEENFKALTQEILDEVQLRIGALIKIGGNIGLTDEVMLHNAKLIGRGWESDKILRVRVINI